MQINASFKGFPGHHEPVDLAHIGDQNWHLLKGHLPFPLAVIKASAIAHNLKWMQDFCNSRKLDIAPHGKTTMSPELYKMQIDAGAWGISFATVFQAGLGIRNHVKRIIIANQVFQASDLDALSHLLETHSDVRVFFLVDSLAQLKQIETWRASSSSQQAFSVLIELGIDGKRTGCRDHETAMQLAREIKATQGLLLAGIECYEGALATCHHEHDQAAVTVLMQRVQNLALACEKEDLFQCAEVLITAGGSAIFDLVAAHLEPQLSRPARGILRSGCYLTHDHVEYRKMLRCVGERLKLAETLKPALEVISSVQSCPEPGLALLSMGKRDVSYDIDFPVPIWQAAIGDAAVSSVPAHWEIKALNDQHAYLHFNPQAPASEHPYVGQIIGSGISHPCTTFDKWRWMPIVNDDYVVTSGISIHF
jgi:D-serine dehydratase